ncbi:MAG: hypothetical protein IKO35_06685 [Elusimicrobiaceae bacterium]|nr:hypothetical protein [Elusimicrobiaceae bacterium]
MKHKLNLFILCIAGLLSVAACRTVRVEGPEVSPQQVKPALKKAKQSLMPTSLSTKELPPVLGGLIQSDNWIIYKDKKQEEFKGNVSYDNGTYIFRAGYALSDRAKGTFFAKDHVYLRQNAPEGAFYEAQGDNAWYNYQTQQGKLSATGKAPVKLVYRDEKGQTLMATARQATVLFDQKIYILEKDVRVMRPSPQGMQTVTAQKVTIKQAQNQALLEGNATLSDPQRTLQAQTIFYDGQKNLAYAYGERPLAQGTTEQGTFAVIADHFQSDNNGEQITLDGKVQGWLISPKINEASLNAKF